MQAKAKTRTDLFDRPNGAVVSEMDTSEKATATGKTDGKFTEVDFGDGSPPMWAKTDDLAFENGNPEPFDLATLVETCVFVERTINDVASTAPWFISADFILARGQIETGLTSAGQKIPGSDAVGPFQVSTAEWKTFCDTAGDLARDILPKHRVEPLLQVYSAGFRMFADAKAISNLMRDKGVGTNEKPFMPSFLDLFHAYLGDSPQAAVAIKQAQDDANKKNTSVKDVLAGALREDRIKALFTARSGFTGTIEAPKTVAQFVEGTTSALNDALKKASDHIQEFVPTAAQALSAEGGIDPSNMPISQAAFDLIVEFEVSSKAAYERKYTHPVWPGGASGVTIGIGYDVGQQNVAQIRGDFAGILDPATIAALEPACGVKGAPARGLAGQLHSVTVSWEQALALFQKKGIPRWVGIVKKNLANTDKLKPDSLGALVSLTYNRGGGGYTLTGGRYAEMRNIKQHMANQAFANIPGEIRNMKRLWPGVGGLLRRRDREAELFKHGLQ